MLETPESIVMSIISEADLLLSGKCDLYCTKADELEKQLRAFANQLLQTNTEVSLHCFDLARGLRQRLKKEQMNGRWGKTTELIVARRFDGDLYPEKSSELTTGISTMIVAKLHLLLDGKEVLETSGIRFGFVGDGLSSRHIGETQIRGNMKGDWIAPVKRRAKMGRGKDLCGFMNDIAIQQGFSDFDRMSISLCKDVERPGGSIIDNISLPSCTLDSQCLEESLSERKYISLSRDPDDIINQVRMLVYEITEMARQLSNFGGLPRPRIVGRVLDGGKRFSR